MRRVARPRASLEHNPGSISSISARPTGPILHGGTSTCSSPIRYRVTSGCQSHQVSLAKSCAAQLMKVAFPYRAGSSIALWYHEYHYSAHQQGYFADLVGAGANACTLQHLPWSTSSQVPKLIHHPSVLSSPSPHLQQLSWPGQTATYTTSSVPPSCSVPWPNLAPLGSVRCLLPLLLFLAKRH